MNDLCVFLPVDYEGIPGRWRFLPEALARHLIGISKVLCVNRPVCPVVSTIKHRKKLIKWLGKFIKRSGHIQQITENLFLFTPFVFLHDQLASKLPFMTELNSMLLRFQLKRVLTKLDFRIHQLISVIYTPYQKDFAGIVGEKFLVYDCYDEYTAGEDGKISNDKRCWIRQNEMDIMKKADLVLVASEMLMKNKCKYHHNIHYVPNAADVELFQLVQSVTTEIASDILNFPHPIIGYSGIISRRIDFELIDYLAQMHPEWSFAFIGPLDYKDLHDCMDFKMVRQLENVFFMGERPYKKLPSYLKAFDVCILPYKPDKFNLSCSPLKFYEYLATGRPIISTNLPALQSFHNIINIAQNAGEFEQLVSISIKEHDKELIEQRMETARENSWEKRAETIIDILGKILVEKDRSVT